MSAHQSGRAIGLVAPKPANQRFLFTFDIMSKNEKTRSDHLHLRDLTNRGSDDLFFVQPLIAKATRDLHATWAGHAARVRRAL